MPTASSIVLNDGQGTPAAHTFEPQSVVPSRTVLVDRDSTTSAGQKQLILGLDPSKPGRSTSRVNIRFNYPVEHTVDGIVEVAYVARFSGDVVIPDQMTQAERDNLAAFLSNAFANSVVSGYVADLDPMY